MNSIYLQLTDKDAFIQELKSRGITEVRRSDWSQIKGAYETRKVRFTAWDPQNSIILRMDVVYYRGFYYPPDSPAGKENARRIDEALIKTVGPIINEIGSVAEIKNGEYHLGEPKW